MKKESNFKSKIQELKKTDRGNAILKLTKWGIFFVILFIFIFVTALISPRTNNHNPSKVPTNVSPKVENNTLTKEKLKTIEQNLLNANYTYKFDININNNRYLYNGTVNNNTNTGFKETKDSVIKYYIDNTGIYHDNLGEKKLITNLYEGVNQNYLDLNYIFNILNNLDFNLKQDHNCKKPLYEFKNNENIYHVHFSHENINQSYINEILITSNNNAYSYRLTFEMLGGE